MNKINSIFDEINNLIPVKNKDIILESRGKNLIESCINFLNSLNEYYDDDITLDLKNRFISSIKNNNPEKYKRKFKTIKGK